MERLLDLAAARLGLDRVAIRERNLIQPDAFPYDVGLVSRDNGPRRYDSGNYPECLRRARRSRRLEDVRARSAPTGDGVGLGLALFVEDTGLGPYEGIRVRVESRRARLRLLRSVQPGPGPRDDAGPDRGRRALGADRTGHRGAGRYRRSPLRRRHVRQPRRRARAARLPLTPPARCAGRRWPSPPSAWRPPSRTSCSRTGASACAAHRIAVSRSATIAAIASAPRPGYALPGGMDPGLEASGYVHVTQSTYSSGAHAAVVEVDPETGVVRLLRYVAVDDCGVMINPMVVEGQVHGGIAHGIGNALLEARGLRRRRPARHRHADGLRAAARATTCRASRFTTSSRHRRSTRSASRARARAERCRRPRRSPTRSRTRSA